MRENLAKSNSMGTLSFNGLQTPYTDINNEQKQMLFSVSSNVYYGYQPLTTVQHAAEPMHTEDLSNHCDGMDTTQLEGTFVNRKRTRNHTETTGDNCKKRRQNESEKPNNNTLLKRYSPTKVVLDEDLLRETHGCSYYHWVASNI